MLEIVLASILEAIVKQFHFTMRIVIDVLGWTLRNLPRSRWFHLDLWTSHHGSSRLAEIDPHLGNQDGRTH